MKQALMRRTSHRRNAKTMPKNPIQTAEYQMKNHSPSRFLGLYDSQGCKNSGAAREKMDLDAAAEGFEPGVSAAAVAGFVDGFEGERMRFFAPGEVGSRELMSCATDELKVKVQRRREGECVADQEIEGSAYDLTKQQSATQQRDFIRPSRQAVSGLPCGSLDLRALQHFLLPMGSSIFKDYDVKKENAASAGPGKLWCVPVFVYDVPFRTPLPSLSAFSSVIAVCTLDMARFHCECC